MLEFTLEQIAMHQTARDKPDALRLLADRLVADGLVAPGYLGGLESRESQGSTFLGQGIAIPHGTPETRPLVFTTGIRLLHFPEGVDWGDGQTVYLAIGIAAKSDEHLRLLQLLTRALGDADLGAALRAAREPGDLLRLLQGTPGELALDARLIGLDLTVDDFEELVWQGARLLRRSDCVDNGFAAVLHQVEPLHLGEGLWWLHSEQMVRQPALAFVTPDKPLRHLGQPLSGLFCLASLGQAHEALLEKLCNLLIEGRGPELVRAANSRAVLQALGGEMQDDWPTARAILVNAHGLHARPAKVLAQLAKSFEGEIRVRLAGSEAPPVSAKSLSKLLSLGVRCGQELEFTAQPDIAEAALDAIRTAVQEGLGETAVQAAQPLGVPPPASAFQPSTSKLSPGSELRAVCAAPGIAIGPAHVLMPLNAAYPQRGESLVAEQRCLREALDGVRADIQRLATRSGSPAVHAIFVTHLEMLADPALHDDVETRLERGESAPAAWTAVIEAAARQQERLPDALLAERAIDLRDIGRRVLARLCGAADTQAPEQPYVLVMDEVGPSDVARLDPSRVAGILAARGGATAHSAIVARAMGIPSLVGAGDVVLSIEQGTALVLDALRGRLTVSPDEGTLHRAEHARDSRAERVAHAQARRNEPARMRDGHSVSVMANIGEASAVAIANEQGAEGIGLLRTELLFMGHAQAPDEATQETEYRRVLDDLQGRPLVVRTLDVGGDKPLPYWPMDAERNPFLGVRGIRLTLERPHLMESQLRALLRAAAGRALRIMFPMVSQLEEWRTARRMVQRLLLDHPVQDLQLGIMVEVPSAALLAPVLAREVDFFSIGTNDLTQYTLAMDRDHPRLSAQADGLHPAVLRLIDMTVRAAHANGKWVGVCGELAADPEAVPLLLGLGVDELSVAPGSIAEVKACVREWRLDDARRLAQAALSAGSAREVRDSMEAP